ncbi:MAG: VWA domain-containing protein [Acidobacteriota bacterium]|nr:VWA domain-containing protein [Acidobacteriota bacterium]
MLLPRLKLFLLVSILILSLSALSNAQSRRVPPPTPTPSPEKDDDPVRVVTEEIKLNVLAFDGDGKFVTDVKEADLVITENDILHQPSSVRRIPANILIVMDTGGEMRQVKSLEQTRKTAKAIVTALKPEDSIAVLQYGDTAQIVAEWTNDKTQILNTIDRTKFGRRSAFVEALGLAKDFLLKNSVENKHLVLITDGTDSLAKSSEKADAMRNLLSTDINVHVISYTRMEATVIEPRTKTITNTPPPKAMPDEVAAQLPNGVRDNAQAPKVGPTINLDRKLLKNLKARKADLEASERSLSNLAENTNGEFILPESLDEMVEKSALVAKMIDSSYVVTYTPKIPLNENSAERNIIVTSKRPNLLVQARRKLIVNGRN